MKTLAPPLQVRMTMGPPPQDSAQMKSQA